MDNNNELRQISIEGAPKIGEGAHGEVYRLDDETIVKVYRPFVSMEDIEREKQLSKWAFVKGVPTAISFHIVRVGERYGIVYELLNARSASEYVRESEENLEDFVRKSVELMDLIHSIEVEPGELKDMKVMMLDWITKCREYMSPDTCDRLVELVEEVPDSHTLLHADFHLKNIMVTGDELMLIDMDTLCVGDPIFELATIYNSYKEFPSISPEAAAFLGIDVATAGRIWDRTIELCGGDEDMALLAQIFGCIRIIDYLTRHNDTDVSEMCIAACCRDIEKALALISRK